MCRGSRVTIKETLSLCIWWIKLAVGCHLLLLGTVWSIMGAQIKWGYYTSPEGWRHWCLYGLVAWAVGALVLPIGKR